MHYIYLIQSVKFPNKKYIGYTINLKERFNRHNRAGFKHTTRYRPWRLVACLAFDDQDKALAFERYLKSGAGRAFAKKRFW